VTAGTGPLADVDVAMLRLAGRWWRDPAAKEAAIRERFGLAPVRFYQRLNALLELPAAAAAEPLIVARLQRIRDSRASRLGRARAGGVR
jgi:hypothetical protein